MTINPHVSSQWAKEVGDEIPVQSEAQMSATIDPTALQTIMDQTLRHQVEVIEQTLNQQIDQFKKVFMELNQRSNSGDRASEACLNKLRPAPYSGAADGVVDPWIKLMESFMENIKSSDKLKAGMVLNHLTKEGKSYVQTKPDEHIATPEKIYQLLKKRFGA